MAIVNAPGGANPNTSREVTDVMNLVQGVNTTGTRITTGSPGRFRQIMGGIVGAAGSIMMPGVGGALGSIIAGRGSLGTTGTGVGLGTPSSGLLGDSTAYLQLQAQMTMEQRQFETASTILKNRHEAAMTAIRNMKAS